MTGSVGMVADQPPRWRGQPADRRTGRAGLATTRAGGTEPLSQPYLSANVFQLAGKRAPWLLLAVAFGLTVNVMHLFEGALEAVVALAFFIPLLIGTGGNSGAQAATLVVRAVVSTPLIAILVDTTGLVIYFLVAHAVLTSQL